MIDYQGKRFKDYVKNRHIPVSDVAKKLGVSRQTVYQYFDSTNLTREVVNRILSEFDAKENDVFGGEMHVVNSNTKTIGNVEGSIDENTPYTKIGEGQYLMIMPLVPENAYAGYLSGYADKEYIEDLPKHSIIVSKYYKGNYRAFEIVGDSMDNNLKESIPDGSIFTAREIQQTLWTSKLHTHRYKDYVIVHKNDGIVTKRIIAHDVINGVIICHSLNSDKNSYPDFEVHLDDVQQIFNIVNVSQAR